MTRIPKAKLDPEYEITALGQVFTPPVIAKIMCNLVQNKGQILEPACGDGVFLKYFPEAYGIEIDPRHAPPDAKVMNFFDFSKKSKFETIIGNPPYVRYQDISKETRSLIKKSILDRRANLYLYFIEKCLEHLSMSGELIFVTPRDFLKATSAVPLNRELFKTGTITDFIDLGDQRLFNGATPNCAIWRFEKNNFSRRTNYAEQSLLKKGDETAKIIWQKRLFTEQNGQLSFTRHHYPINFSSIASVKVGAVSGADDIFAHEELGNRDFVCSATLSTGQTRKMIWCGAGDPIPEFLIAHKEKLMARRIRKFNEKNWWQWGRGYVQSDHPRIYVNSKTRRANPFFIHPCKNYDGSMLAIFPHDPTIDLQLFSEELNQVDWADLGFVCDGRFLFTQRSLEQVHLPSAFEKFLPNKI